MVPPGSPKVSSCFWTYDPPKGSCEGNLPWPSPDSSALWKAPPKRGREENLETEVRLKLVFYLMS